MKSADQMLYPLNQLKFSDEHAQGVQVIFSFPTLCFAHMKGRNLRQLFYAFVLVCWLTPLSNVSWAADPVKVEAILVKTNDWVKFCPGGFKSYVVDLSEWDFYKTDCSIKLLINQKISGTKQLQVFHDNSWVDLIESDHWMNTSRWFQNNDEVSTFAFPRKLQDADFGKLLSSKKFSTFGGSDRGASWGTPLPYLDSREMGGDVYDQNVTKVQLRAKVVGKSKTYYSNPITFIYKNHEFVVWGVNKDGLKDAVPRSQQSGQAQNQKNPSISGGSGIDSICKAAAQSKNGLSYVQVSVNDPVTAQLVIENKTDCFFTLQVSATFWCRTPNNIFRSTTTLQLGPREQLSPMPGYYSQYFPTAIQQCLQISGTGTNGKSWAIFSSYPANASILIISSSS